MTVTDTVDVTAVRARVAADFAAADPAHDLAHLDRVAHLAGVIAAELGADPTPARVAAYVHDYHRVAEARQGWRPLRPEQAASAVTAVLTRCAVPRAWHAEIHQAVALTGRYGFGGDDLSGAGPTALAVHDADNLDATGAVGIGRAFAFGSLLGQPLWDPDTTPRATYAEGATSSVLAHFYEKLVRLEDDMLTEPGRRLAADRTLLLHRFAADFRTEWEAGTPAASGAGRVRFDAATRFLSVTTHREPPHAAATTRIAFRGRVELLLADGDQPVAVELADVPTALACCLPAPTPGTDPPAWSCDPATGLTRVRLTEAPQPPRPRRLRGVADVEVRVAADEPTALLLHLCRAAAGDEAAS